VNKRLIAVALLALPPLLIAWGSAKVADAAGRSVARGLELATPWLAPRSSAHPDAEPTAHITSDAELTTRVAPSAPETRVSSTTRGAVATKSRAARAIGRTLGEPPRHGLRVSAATVLRLANGGARPGGVFVAADGQRPAGLALSGVSALGVGLRDGDVLTHAGGRPALSRGDVIGVVIASRGAGAREISGRFWRDGEPWNLIVEQPYVTRSSRTAGTGQTERPASSLRVASR
jgi:hypothetical protein